MSRNGSGVYSLPAGNPVVTGTTIASTWANNTLSDIATALTGSVASDGQTPLTGNLNLNNNKIINLTDPTNAQDGATKAYTDTAVAAYFPSGTRLIFAQNTAPTGWTKDTTNYNNHALRVVTGTGGVTGGSVDFSTAFVSQAVTGTVGTSGATTLSVSQIPSHTHKITSPAYGGYVQSETSGGFGAIVNRDAVGSDDIGNANNWNASDINASTGGSHTHSGGTFTGTAINLAVKYLDVITATKN
jgi:hypothetical protein